MKRFILSGLILILSTLFCVAQHLHGMTIDAGKNHPADSSHITHFSIGLSNHTDTLKGVQLNAISNYAYNARGLQLSGFSNISSSPMKGLQLSGVTNISMGVEKGVQLSGIHNISSGYMRGVQLGASNYAEELNGAQIGLLNTAQKHTKGWQVGLINYTKDTGGHKIGFVNVNPKTTIDVMVFGGTSSNLYLEGIRS